MTETLRPLRLAIAGGLLLLSPVLLAASKTAAPARHAAGSPAESARAAAGSPEEVVDLFLKAESNSDDEKAYSYLSSAARAKTTLKEWANRAHQVRGTFSAITLVAGEALLIGGGGSTENKVYPPVYNGANRDHATVKIVQMLPVPDNLQLVKENGRWVIDIQKTLGGDETPAKTATQAPAPPPVKPVTPPPPDPSLQCRFSLRQVGTAFRVYALDHNGKLPDAATWTDEMMPYLQSPNLLKCPPDSHSDSSYAMNSALSGMKLTDISNPDTRILLYETTTTTKNVSGLGETQPSASPHPSGYLVLYANGESVFRTEKPVVQ